MKNSVINDYDNIELMGKKIHYLLGSRLRNKNSIKKAIQKQEEIRNRHSTVEAWDSVTQIRKWREHR